MRSRKSVTLLNSQQTDVMGIFDSHEHLTKALMMIQFDTPDNVAVNILIGASFTDEVVLGNMTIREDGTS